MSTLYFENSNDLDQVWVVKSNETVKFSGNFTNFMRKNNIVKGDLLKFSLVAEKTFVVIKM